MFLQSINLKFILKTVNGYSPRPVEHGKLPVSSDFSDHRGNPGISLSPETRLSSYDMLNQQRKDHLEKWKHRQRVFKCYENTSFPVSIHSQARGFGTVATACFDCQTARRRIGKICSQNPSWSLVSQTNPSLRSLPSPICMDFIEFESLLCLG